MSLGALEKDGEIMVKKSRKGQMLSLGGQRCTENNIGSLGEGKDHSHQIDKP